MIHPAAPGTPLGWIGSYELLRQLRAGGMATTYLARRHGAAGFSRVVVIKLVHPHLSQQEQFISMFMDEARITARIQHPNVVHVEEFGEFQGGYYLVMERVPGCSLNQLMRHAVVSDADIPVEVAAHIACQAAAGLHAAHEAVDEQGRPLGIVHRDVSPSNILLSKAGHVKVIDFGVAKARGRLSVTSTGQRLKGKLRYMSPEQAMGMELDRRSDVFSLGVVLWEMLARRALFDGQDELRVLAQVRSGVIPPVSRFNPQVPLALEQVIEAATAKEVEDRPATCAELRRMVAEAVPGALALDTDVLGRLVVEASDEIEVSATPTSGVTTPTSGVTTPAGPGRHAGAGPEVLAGYGPGAVAGREMLSWRGESSSGGERRRRRRLLVGAAIAGAVTLGIALAIALWPIEEIATRSPAAGEAASPAAADEAAKPAAAGEATGEAAEGKRSPAAVDQSAATSAAPDAAAADPSEEEEAEGAETADEEPAVEEAAEEKGTADKETAEVETADKKPARSSSEARNPRRSSTKGKAARRRPARQHDTGATRNREEDRSSERGEKSDPQGGLLYEGWEE